MFVFLYNCFWFNICYICLKGFKALSPTVLRHKNFRFFFFSREEERMHVHISSADGEAKFWLEPMVALADFDGLSKKQLNELKELTEKYAPEFKKAWKKHFFNS